MGKVAAFHSKKPGAPQVHHNNNACTEGNNIEPQNKVSGDGGRPLCKRCSELR